jgi:hypothetical protein
MGEGGRRAAAGAAPRSLARRADVGLNRPANGARRPPPTRALPRRAGTFGRVLECWDRLHRDYVAIKIVRNVDKYRHAAMLEVGGGRSGGSWRRSAAERRCRSRPGGAGAAAGRQAALAADPLRRRRRRPPPQLEALNTLEKNDPGSTK